jgi:hypothetical protein
VLKTCPSSIAFALTTSILSREVGVVAAAKYTNVGKSTIAATLSRFDFYENAKIIERANHASPQSYLAFDFMVSNHSGAYIEGLDRHYSSSHKRVELCHRFANMTLVNSTHEPIPLHLAYEVSKNLATEEYEYRKSVESLIHHVKQMQDLKINFVGVLADGEFTQNEGLRQFVELKINYLGRIKSNRIIEWNGQKIKLTELVKKFPPKSCHLDTKLNWRSKRIPVKINQIDVDIIIIYRKSKGIWTPFFLVSTFPPSFSMGELLRAWKARWKIEVVHRFIKQNFQFAKCRSKKIRAHENWANLVLDAYFAVLIVKRRSENLLWCTAQQIAAEEYKNIAVTALSEKIKPIFAA